MQFYERIPGANYTDQVYLTSVRDEDGEPLLELRVTNDDEEVAIPLSDYGIRELRLALSRYERLLNKERG